MGGNSTFGTSYSPESLLWEQWRWPNQLGPFDLSKDKSNRKTNCYSDDLESRKPTGRTPLGDQDINPQIKKTGKYSPVRRTSNTSSNGAHAAQQDNDRMKKIRERNRIAANKLRIKQREEQQGLESSKQDLERINRDLSTCVADLTVEVYELKMQLLQQAGCNCTLIQNYLAHESQRYLQTLLE
uniref:BZIP domain-containing protein n=1 Tax=Fusarium oxysporum (strain Fo5176) TaxID=660025 RepID=A0A0D2YF35_FUSOF